MILTDYYRFEKLTDKARTRLDCTACTGSYEPFEEKRATTHTKETATRAETLVGALVVYYGDVPEQYSADAKRKAGKSLSIKGKNLSSVYVPNPALPFAFGDVAHTADAVLVTFDEGFETVSGRLQVGSVMHLYVARGYSKDVLPLYTLLTEGGLDEDMAALQARAVTQIVTSGQACE